MKTPVKSEALATAESPKCLRAHDRVASRTSGDTAGNTYPGSLDREIAKKNTGNANHDKTNSDVDPLHGVRFRSTSAEASRAKKDHGKIETNITGM